MEEGVKDTNIQNSFTYTVLKKEGEKLTSVMTTWMMMIIIIMILGVGAKRQKGSISSSCEVELLCKFLFFSLSQMLYENGRVVHRNNYVDMHTMQ